MKIAIASDHGGLNLKKYIYNYLIEKNIEIVDFGTNDFQSCDYPIYAKKVCEEILNNNFDRGILICSTGIGMSMCANRYKGIRAACVSDTYSAKMTRAHNNSNVLCFGEKVVGIGLAGDIVDIWLNTGFDGDRHQRRIDMLDN